MSVFFWRLQQKYKLGMTCSRINDIVEDCYQSHLFVIFLKKTLILAPGDN